MCSVLDIISLFENIFKKNPWSSIDFLFISCQLRRIKLKATKRFLESLQCIEFKDLGLQSKPFLNKWLSKNQNIERVSFHMQIAIDMCTRYTQIVHATNWCSAQAICKLKTTAVARTEVNNKCVGGKPNQQRIKILGAWRNKTRWTDM